ncbi:winged helix-turn-helix transcriptional regulator [Gluconacetobacter sp. 1b LMG 1731]|uniref:Winged helix-turn-helix transcriptional regulator n=1 Tax=Gluconacetobacter dulcium TaxID=2729096 RepID=A0A7W4INL2_9PROT|nr:MarR family winged helix-turn-helix transcriptional regulator [Gluconacetobacter dulcium]MBB2166143.1 winged helix-turn-helix transcriptional regulator [Gluconacetobacter dulcium]MBB2195224.1 winged helix-turn-helix transcriptional regulator [Gluconacetobacter dulcium]MBB2196929.1 winged helix-turn-helix transcriptional regulator [Gluconacetobacter dulcium]
MTEDDRSQATGLRASLNIDEAPFAGMPVTFRVMRLGAVWRTRLERELKPTGMTVAGFRPMVYLMMMPEGTSQRDLAAALDTDTSALVRVLDLLETAGLVERRPDSVDRRANNLFITPEGRRKCRAFHEIAARVEAELTEGLSAGAVADLVGRLEHILDNAARPPATDMADGGETT